MKGLKPEAIKSESNNKPLITKEIYDKILDERMDEIIELSREINFNNLIYHFKGSSISTSFTVFGGPMHAYNHLKNGDKALSQVGEDHITFRSELGQISSGNSKSENQLNTIKTVTNLYNSQQKTIDLLNDNLRIISEAIYNANKKAKEQDLKY